MRIVAGKYGGRKLNVPSGRDVRPTSDKVRGAIFNALNSRINVDGVIVMDVFCGTGAMGLEALSRGAAHCTFVDKACSSINLAKKNAKDFGALEVEFITKDADKIPVKPHTSKAANLVFLDPPYQKDLLLSALKALCEKEWLAHGGVLVAESEKDNVLNVPDGFQVTDERIYKDTKITYLKYKI